MKLFEIEQMLKENGHKLDKYIGKDDMYANYLTKHHDIVSIAIYFDNDTCIHFYIDIKPSCVQVYRNHGYHMDPIRDHTTPVCGGKHFQSLENLLDELQDLGLINCGYNIKGV